MNGKKITPEAPRILALPSKMRTHWKFETLPAESYKTYLGTLPDNVNVLTSKGYCTYFYKLFFDRWDPDFPVLRAQVPELLPTSLLVDRKAMEKMLYEFQIRAKSKLILLEEEASKPARKRKHTKEDASPSEKRKQ
jgi:hypothetical protein